MRGRLLALLLLVCGRAHAQPAPTEPDPFPVELPERPLVLPCGTTELELSEEFRTQVRDVEDMMGNVTRERSGFADDRSTDLRVSHAFRNVELGAGIGMYVRVSADIDTFAAPRRVSVGAAFSAVQADGRYVHSQYVNVGHKLRLIPRRLSIVGGASILVYELLAIKDEMPLEGTVGFARAGASLYAQLGWRLGFTAGVGAGAPLWQSEAFGSRFNADISTYLYLGLRRWDFYVGGNLGDVTRREPSTYFTFGVLKRWGL